MAWLDILLYTEGIKERSVYLPVLPAEQDEDHNGTDVDGNSLQTALPWSSTLQNLIVFGHVHKMCGVSSHLQRAL